MITREELGRLHCSCHTVFGKNHGVPATANQPLLQDVLREKLGFDGLIISDWAAVAELMAHRVAADRTEAAKKAFKWRINIAG